jgi:hypothetical protein
MQGSATSKYRFQRRPGFDVGIPAIAAGQANIKSASLVQLSVAASLAARWYLR